MKATTHTELYRPFQGEFKARPNQALVLARSALRQTFKKKLPMLFLYGPTSVLSITFSVLVAASIIATKKAAKAAGGEMDEGALTELLGTTADRILGVPGQLPGFMTFATPLMILAMVWYGAGMISDDRRTGANLLYFARPLTRVGYGLGKGLGLAFIGGITLLAPSMLICAIASVTSPDWSFLKEEWSFILKLAFFCSLWIVVVSSIVLGLSSLVTRRSIALVLSFATIFVFSGVAEVVHLNSDQPLLAHLSLFTNFQTLAAALFDQEMERHWNLEVACWALAGTTAGSLFLLSRGIRRMEVVG